MSSGSVSLTSNIWFYLFYICLILYENWEIRSFIFITMRQEKSQQLMCKVWKELRLSSILGQRPQRGWCPVEYRGNLYIRPSICPFIPPPQPASHCRALDGWMDGHMDRLMDVCTDFPCILQEIVPFGATALPTSKLLLQCWWAGQGYRWPSLASGRLVLRMTTGFFVLYKMWTPFFNLTIVPEETTGLNCLKFGMIILFYISFWLTKASFEILPQTQFLKVAFSFFYDFYKI